MNGHNWTLEWGTERDLARVIEPLASFISAADHPKAALMSAMAVLVSEVERTNRAAFAHVTSFLESRRS
jgi:hypothetical protein